LAEKVKRQQDVAERQNRISMLLDQSREPQSKSPEAAIDEFCASNGSDFEKDKKRIFFRKLGDRIGRTNPPADTIDEASLSSADQWIHQFIKSVDHFTRVGYDVTKMTTRQLNEGEDFYILPLSFAADTQSFVDKNMPVTSGLRKIS
jgi:hypothetical protein